ncbi:TPA: hypothetical protein N0F65_009412 [Lagenidium giganteum]|uniref:Retrovirus-related Pol polyprotein from transposon TNT 1-94-like beta-barrel domain-containing protein n=1 Tax=Lagenidium giganteum TaxID=4803 RepID=A0AAV2ZDK3_9STRA|nr:TPA: hypothetical protein N0F65_009412 [Lagenidium giganteum]
MSPSFAPHEILKEDNYFVWEFNARIALARKELLQHIERPRDVDKASEEWRVADLKVLALIVKMISPLYQSMVRGARTTADAWNTLREFFVKRSLHNRVLLRQQLHEFKMNAGDNLKEYFVRFDDLCLKLAAVGDEIREVEKLSFCWEAFRATKELLHREFENIRKPEHVEDAFKSEVRGTHGRWRRNPKFGPQGRRGDGVQGPRTDKTNGDRVRGYECYQWGHKRNVCPKRQRRGDQVKADQYVFAVSGGSADPGMWIMDSGASSHMSNSIDDFEMIREIDHKLDVIVANGENLKVQGVGSVRLALPGRTSMVITDVMLVLQLDRKLLSVPALIARGVEVGFEKNGASDRTWCLCWQVICA